MTMEEFNNALKRTREHMSCMIIDMRLANEWTARGKTEAACERVANATCNLYFAKLAFAEIKF
jgi:hypothetical protein